MFYLGKCSSSSLDPHISKSSRLTWRFVSKTQRILPSHHWTVHQYRAMVLVFQEEQPCTESAGWSEHQTRMFYLPCPRVVWKIALLIIFPQSCRIWLHIELKKQFWHHKHESGKGGICSSWTNWDYAWEGETQLSNTTFYRSSPYGGPAGEYGKELCNQLHYFQTIYRNKSADKPQYSRTLEVECLARWTFWLPNAATPEVIVPVCEFSLEPEHPLWLPIGGSSFLQSIRSRTLVPESFGSQTDF